MQVRCEPAVQRYQAAEEGSTKQELAHLEIRHCMASQIESCQEQADALVSAMEAGDEKEEARLFAEMNACVDRFSHMMNKVLARASMHRELQEGHESA